MKRPISEPLRLPASYGNFSADLGATEDVWIDVEQRLQLGRNYWLATTRPDGRPHIVPIWAVWMDGQLLFGTDPHSRKARNLSAQTAAAVHLESGDEVVILEGIAEPLGERGAVERLAEAYRAKYGVELMPEDPSVAYYAFIS